VNPVVAEDVGAALHDRDVVVGGRLPVGGDPVAGAVRVVDVAPLQLIPVVGVAAVRGDEPDLVGVIVSGRTSEWVKCCGEQEVERLQLVGPVLAGVPAGERPQ